MSALVQRVTEYRVEVVAEVVATVKGTLRFTDDDVREWAGIESDGNPVDPELIDEYASELIGEQGDLEVVEVTDWRKTEATVKGTSERMQAPPEFVALPGMEGTL